MDGFSQDSVTLHPDRHHRYAHLEHSPSSPSVCEANQSRNDKKSNRSCCSRKCACRLVYFFTIVALILSIGACIGSGMDLFDVLKSYEEDYNICIPYNSVKVEELIHVSDLRKRVIDNQFVYCADTPSKIVDHLEETIKMRSESYGREVVESISEIVESGKSISGHLLLSPMNERCRGQTQDCEAALLTTRSMCHYDGVKTSEHRIIIELNGTYYLYNQVYFKLIPGTNIQEKQTTVDIRHSVYLRRDTLPENNGYRELLSSRDLIYMKGKNHYFRSSPISGSFNFQAGDEIFVTVSDLNHISRTLEHNFVGLFLMG